MDSRSRSSSPADEKNEATEMDTFPAPASIQRRAFSSVMPPPSCSSPGHASSASLAAASLPGPSMMTCAPRRPFFLYSPAKYPGGCLDTWFVCSVDSLSLRLPPTICFTCPACMSIQGRNRVIASLLVLELFVQT